MDKHIFKRKIYDKMLRWKQDSLGRSALLIEGARRVGKSTIVREFASREYSSHIIIDFNFVTNEVLGYFEQLNDLDLLFLRLQNYYNVRLEEHRSAIIFDEVQRCSAARQAIKYLVQDGRYDYIETVCI
ncbi:MAG: AAA family ATPase [Bacteroidales bacterium]|nr:AAA family ATPase [Bacteroidales bacterium]